MIFSHLAIDLNCLVTSTGINTYVLGRSRNLLWCKTCKYLQNVSKRLLQIKFNNLYIYVWRSMYALARFKSHEHPKTGRNSSLQWTILRTSWLTTVGRQKSREKKWRQVSNGRGTTHTKNRFGSWFPYN